MEKPLRIIPAALLLLLAACTYEPEEVYFNEIDHPEPLAGISLNTFDDTDTIRIYSATEFSYQVGISRGMIEKIEVLLDGQQVSSSGGTSGTFAINHSILKTGTFELKIRFVSTAGTGSLADRVGAENYEVWRKWTLMIDVSPPPKPVLTQFSENGLVKLNWNGYNKPNFVKYTIVATQLNSTRQVVNITDHQQTTWTDSSYVGGYPVTYSLTTQALGNRTSDPKTVSDTHIFNVTYTAFDSTAVLHWKKPTYYGACKEIVVYEGSTEKFHISLTQDTTLTYTPEVVHRATVGLRLRVIPRLTSNYSPMDVYQDITNLTGAKKIPHIPSNINYNSGTDSFYAFTNLGQTRLIQYDADMLEKGIVPIKNASYNIPFNGTLIYFNDGRTVVQHNLLTQQQKRHTITANPFVSSVSITSASADEVVSYSCRNIATSTTPETTYGVIHNMAANVTISATQTVQRGSFYSATISNNGKYVYYSITHLFNTASQEFYRINGGTLTPNGTPDRNSFITYRADNSEEMFIRAAVGVNVCSSNDRSVIRTVAGPVGYAFYGYDPATKYALFMKPLTKVQYLVHIDTQETRAIKVYFTGNEMTYKLLNGILFGDDGSYLRVL